MSADQIDKLGLAIARKFKHDDFAIALARYPGEEEPATCLKQNLEPKVSFCGCLEKIDKEGTMIPFLSRVVEHKWDDEGFRAIIFGYAADVVRSSPGVDQHIATITGALADLVGVLAGNAPPKQCPGAPTCFIVRKRKLEFTLFVASLQEFDALKKLHDSLHVLQVQAASWLDDDETADETAAILPVEAIQAIVGRVRDTAGAVRNLLPPDARSISERCQAAADDALARMAAGNVAFAKQQLRGLILGEMPKIDETMFILSRDLPIRALRDLFKAAVKLGGPRGARMDDARTALRRLSDTWRANILEHALWQATDALIHVVADALDNPPDSILGAANDPWMAIRRNLQVLVDTSLGEAVTEAMAGYAVSTPGPSADESLATLRNAFDGFRADAGMQFLAVDQTLKAVFEGLMPLGKSLLALLAHIPPACSCPLPPPD